MTEGRADDRKGRVRWLPVLVCFLGMAPYLPLVWPDERVIEADDYQSYQLPTRQFARREFLRGSFPLWMPTLGAGTPLHAAQQAALTYPPLLPFLILPSVNHGLRLCLFSHLLFGYWGQYFLGRRFDLSRGAASLGALLTTLSGYAVGHLMAGHVSLIFGIALIPWLFLALSHFLAQPGPLSASGLTTCVALLLLAGHPQLAYYAFLVAFGWGLASLVAGSAAVHRGQAIGWALAAGTVAFMLLSVQWLPAAELIADGKAFGQRNLPQYFAVESFRPQELVMLVVPNAHGNPYDHVDSFTGTEWRYHERSCYIGLVPLALAAYGFTRRNVAVWQWGFLIACAAAWVIALGDSTAVMGFLIRVVPGLGQFRAPARILAVNIVLSALLAGRGLDDLMSAAPRAGQRRLIVLAVATAALLIAIAAHCWYSPDFLTAYWAYATTVVRWEFVQAGLLMLGSFAAVMLATHLAPRRRLAAQFVVLAMLALDLWATQGRLVRLIEPTSDPGALAPPASPPIRFAPRDVPNADALRYSGAVGILCVRPWSTIETNEGGVLPAALERLIARYVDPEQRSLILRLAACDYCHDTTRRHWEAVAGALPRIRLAAADDVAEFVRQTGNRRCGADAGSVTVLDESAQSLSVHVHADRPTVLIVADCYYPGWEAEIDGQAEPVEAVHGMFRGVSVPEGEHDVHFRYVSRPFRIGLMVSAAGGLVLAGMVIQGLGRRRRECAPMSSHQADSGKP